VSDRDKRRRKQKKEDAKWVKEQVAHVEANPQFVMTAFIERYPERAHDYGAVVFYGPFTNEELDEYDISHSVATGTKENWIQSIRSDATNEDFMKAALRFFKDRKKQLRVRQK